MTIYLLNSDARNIPLADRSVQCIITSPPYYGLRDYGTAQWNGGDPMCDHSPAATPQRRGIASSTLGGGKETTGHQREGYRITCARCGAVRIDRQIGLERTPQEYVASIVAVMRECWRVLKDDGVLWLNIGDSYYNYRPGYEAQSKQSIAKHSGAVVSVSGKRGIKQDGLKEKDLIGIPWRCAFALQDDGWYLRSDIIWSKPNPMPESVTDRPTKAHEYIFLLTKRARYYYDAAAIVEPLQESSVERSKYGWHGRMDFDEDGNELRSQPDPTEKMGDRWSPPNGRNKRSVWEVSTVPYSGAHFATFPPKLVEPMVLAGTSARGECPTCGKAWGRVVERKRLTRPELSSDDPRYRPNTYNGSYKDINGKGDAGYTEVTTIGWLPGCSCYGYSIPQYPDMPEDVTPPNLCDECGGTGIIVFDDLFGKQEQSCRFCNGTGGDHPSPEWIEYQAEVDAVQSERKMLLNKIDQNAVTIPQIILDPFAGTATVGRVAIKHQRRFVGLDLNLKYIGDLARERTSKVQTFMQFATEP